MFPRTLASFPSAYTPATPMNDLLSTLTQTLRPYVADALSAQTDLDADTAAEAVPAVASPLVDGLRRVLRDPSGNIGTLTDLYRFVTADDKPTDPAAATPASEGDTALNLAESLLDGPIGSLVDHVAAQLGVSPDAADLAVRVVVPKAFAVLRGTAQDQGFDELLRLVLDDEAEGQVETILGLIRGADQAGSIMKGLGGLFS